MKATGALPTEERVQKMNDQQWLWSYLNIIQDEEEEEKNWKHRLDYVGWFINEDKYKSVASILKESNNNGQKQLNDNEEEKHYDENPVIVNDSFEEELRRALNDNGENPGAFTELPDSNLIGNPNESKNDFISRVLSNQGLALQNNENIGIENMDIHPIDPSIPSEEELERLGIDPDDIDFIDVP
jgi:hypothetical protein